MAGDDIAFFGVLFSGRRLLSQGPACEEGSANNVCTKHSAQRPRTAAWMDEQLAEMLGVCTI